MGPKPLALAESLNTTSHSTRVDHGKRDIDCVCWTSENISKVQALVTNWWERPVCHRRASHSSATPPRLLRDTLFLVSTEAYMLIQPIFSAAHPREDSSSGGSLQKAPAFR